jgi:hypothetical protein
MFGGPRRHLGCHQHTPTTPARYHTSTTGVRLEPHASGITPAQRTSHGITHRWNHTLHNGHRSESRPAYDHAAHNGRTAQRAFVPHPAPRAIRTTGLRTTPAQRAISTTGLRTTPAQRAPARRRWYNAPSGRPIRCIQNEKGMTITFPGRRTGCRLAAPHR